MLKEKKERLSKKTNRKQNFKKFIESGYSDIKLFLKACKNDENLLIYTCLKPEELNSIIEKMKNFDTLEAQIQYLVDNQPTMNETIERFDKVTSSVSNYLSGYIDYNAFRLSNSTNSAEDWRAELWEKFCKICNFYRIRWFYPEELEKAGKKTSVIFTPMLYKEFIYIVRLSISSERKHRAFLAALHPEDTIFKLSLNDKIDVGDDEKPLAEVISDTENNADTLLENSNVSCLITKALKIAKEYIDTDEVYYKLKKFYEEQDTFKVDKHIVVLGKIFLYKAGLVSPKCLAFIKSLSSTYKTKYNISSAHVNNQLNSLKTKKNIKKVKSPDKKEITYKDLILRKRGEL